MIRKIASVSCFALGLLLFVVGASAHHGGAAYDGSQTITVTGAVTKFEFINPHVLIYIAVTDESGKVVEWSGELTTPIRLARMDSGGAEKWSKDILQPGDEITLSGNPARSGAPSLRLRKVIDSHGVALIGGTN
ncbi:MAG: hypothetical protein E2O55_04945 [Gammaproteobacteria bacterium]|nr:MAG: hypothetical protein E2O55_04945 [Gammaproteobacteria bacterium]